MKATEKNCAAEVINNAAQTHQEQKDTAETRNVSERTVKEQHHPDDKTIGHVQDIRNGFDQEHLSRVAAFKEELLEVFNQPSQEMKGSFGFDNETGGMDYINVHNQKDFLKMVILTQGDQHQVDALTEIEIEKAHQLIGERELHDKIDDTQQVRGSYAEIKAVRVAKLETAFSRLAQFEMQNFPDLTSKVGLEKHTLSFDSDGKINCTVEPLEACELKELDEAIAVISEMERIDMNTVDEIETRVFDEAKERMANGSREAMEDNEKLKYVAELEDSVAETFTSYEDAIRWEREELDNELPSDDFDMER